jgi:hypothetical protein
MKPNPFDPKGSKPKYGNGVKGDSHQFNIGGSKILHSQFLRTFPKEFWHWERIRGE